MADLMNNHTECNDDRFVLCGQVGIDNTTIFTLICGCNTITDMLHELYWLVTEYYQTMSLNPHVFHPA